LAAAGAMNTMGVSGGVVLQAMEIGATTAEDGTDMAAGPGPAVAMVVPGMAVVTVVAIVNILVLGEKDSVDATHKNWGCRYGSAHPSSK
jgi:hypothetical protein